MALLLHLHFQPRGVKQSFGYRAEISQIGRNGIHNSIHVRPGDIPNMDLNSDADNGGQSAPLREM